MASSNDVTDPSEYTNQKKFPTAPIGVTFEYEQGLEFRNLNLATTIGYNKYIRAIAIAKVMDAKVEYGAHCTF